MTTKPVVDGLKPAYEGKVDFMVYGALDVSAQDVQQFASSHGVSAVPTMVLVSAEGRELKRVLGSQNENQLRALLDTAR